MTTITNATAAYPILAIDLGKYKSLACIVRSADDLGFTTLPISRAACRVRLVCADAREPETDSAGLGVSAKAGRTLRSL
jgi:hypothetical protein